MKRNKFVKSFFSFLFFVIFSAAWFFPVIKNFSTSVAGVGGDPYQTLWRFHRLGDTVAHFSIFVPEEKTLPNLAPLPWLPIYYLFGDIVAYNVAWLTAAILAGYLGFLLVRQLRAELIPALFAGLLLEIAPYRIAQSLGHFGAMQIWTILAVFLCFAVSAKKNNYWYFLLGLFFTVWTAWTDHQLFVVLLLILLVGGLFYWKKVVSLRRRLWLFALSFFVAVIISVMPFSGSILNASKSDSTLDLGNNQRETYSATLKSLLMPAPFSLFGAKSYASNFAADNVQTFGFILPVAVLVVFVLTKKHKRDFVLMTLILTGIILALGTTVSVKGFSVPLPGKYLFQLPIISAIRTVGRFAVLPVIFMPLYLAIKTGVKRNQYFIIGVLFLGLVELVPVFGFPVISIDHTLARTVASKLDKGDVLAIPAYTNYQYGSAQLYYSLDYQQIVVGNSALLRIIDPNSLEVFLATPVIRDLVLLRLGDFDLPTIFGQKNEEIVSLALQSQGISNIVFDTKPKGGVVSFEGNKQTVLGPEKIDGVRSYLRYKLGMREEEVGDGVFLYRLLANKTGNAHFYVMEGKGWQIKKKTPERSLIALQQKADFYLYSTEDGTVNLSMLVVDAAGSKQMVFDGKDGTQPLPLTNNNKIEFRLNTVANKLVKYTLRLDGTSILVENPRIQ